MQGKGERQRERRAKESNSREIGREYMHGNAAKSTARKCVVLGEGDERITATALFKVTIRSLFRHGRQIVVPAECPSRKVSIDLTTVKTPTKKPLKIKACASSCLTCNFQASQDERAGDAFNVLPIGRSYKLPPVFRLSMADFAHLTVCYLPSLYVPICPPDLPQSTVSP